MASYLLLRYPSRRHGDDPPVLLLDACVLIVLAKADAAVLAMLSRSLGPAAVLTTTVEEVRQLTPADYLRFGISIEDLTLEEHAAAAGLAAPDTPESDDMCLAACRERAWILATNDRGLRLRCELADVSTIRDLELLLALVEKGALSRARAMTLVGRIHEESPSYFPERLVARFAAELEAIAGSRN